MIKENPKPETRNPKLKILVFNVNWLGDVLFSTPAIGLIRKTYPTAFISCAVPPRCQEILQGNPNLDEIIIYDEDGIQRTFLGKLKFTLWLRKNKFNKAFLFHRSFTRALILFLAGITERIGYRSKKRYFLLTEKIVPPKTDIMHRADYYLNIVTSYLKVSELPSFKLDFFISDKDKAGIDKLLTDLDIKKDDFIVALNPGGNWLQKRWPKENFAYLAKRLVENLKAKVIIIGSEKDIPLAGDITALSGVGLINLCGRMNLKQSAALMQKINVVVSGDSGPLHIAYASGVKVVGLYGPTSALITGPYHTDKAGVIQKDVGCVIPCYEDKCTDLCCMKAITVDEVVACVNQIIKSV
ncbi:MAG: lipopolysaccharide heptosyltransferase II [Candidatus Omnitrophota bacterium]